MKNTPITKSSPELLALMRARQSVRAFTSQPVAPTLLDEILLSARFAPSAVNTQPWQVHLLGQQTRSTLCSMLLTQHQAGTSPNPDYDYYPKSWFEPYKTRRKTCGKALYGALNIEYGDIEARKQQWQLNYEFFHAPVALIFTLHRDLGTGSWIDMGMFLENVMLAACANGLGSCAQASIAEYPDSVRNALKLPEETLIVCGMSLGYPDLQDPINQYRTERAPLDTFLHQHK